MKDSRRSSSTYTESLLLHVVKHNLLFLFLFSIWLFLHEYSRFTGQQVNGEAISLYPFYQFHLLNRNLDISWVIAAESSSLPQAGSRNRAWKLWYTFFRILLSTLALIAAVVKRILKPRETLGNISCVLLSLSKIICKTPPPSQCSRS